MEAVSRLARARDGMLPLRGIVGARVRRASVELKLQAFLRTSLPVFLLISDALSTVQAERVRRGPTALGLGLAPRGRQGRELPSRAARQLRLSGMGKTPTGTRPCAPRRGFELRYRSHLPLCLLMILLQ